MSLTIQLLRKRKSYFLRDFSIKEKEVDGLEMYRLRRWQKLRIADERGVIVVLRVVKGRRVKLRVIRREIYGGA